MLLYADTGYWEFGYITPDSIDTGTVVRDWTNRITSEHADKTNFMAMVAATVEPFADLESLYSGIPYLYDVDYAVGEQLDVIGQWVGVNRYLTTQLWGVYFSFDTDSLGFDQGTWLGPYDPVEGLVVLPDEYFRLIIYARILNNHWNSTLADAYALSAVLFNLFNYQLFIQDQCNLTIYIGLVGDAPPPALVLALLVIGKLDVKPATVRVGGYITQADSGPMFAFDLSSTHFQGFDYSSWATITPP